LSLRHLRQLQQIVRSKHNHARLLAVRVLHVEPGGRWLWLLRLPSERLRG
jgi:hypothetical protein